MEKGEELIRDLLADPQRFGEEGQGYRLLQEYFEGLPLDTLRPLLRHESPVVQGEAMFVASELGEQARPLVDDVIPLVQSGDRDLRYDALEVIAVCCEAERAEDRSCGRCVRGSGSRRQGSRHAAGGQS